MTGLLSYSHKKKHSTAGCYKVNLKDRRVALKKRNTTDQRFLSSQLKLILKIKMLHLWWRCFFWRGGGTSCGLDILSRCWFGLDVKCKAISESVIHMLCRSARATMFIYASMQACCCRRRITTSHEWGSFSGRLEWVQKTKCLKLWNFVSSRNKKQVNKNQEVKKKPHQFNLWQQLSWSQGFPCHEDQE